MIDALNLQLLVEQDKGLVETGILDVRADQTLQGLQQACVERTMGTLQGTDGILVLLHLCHMLDGALGAAVSSGGVLREQGPALHCAGKDRHQHAAPQACRRVSGCRGRGVHAADALNWWLTWPSRSHRFARLKPDVQFRTRCLESHEHNDQHIVRNCHGSRHAGRAFRRGPSSCARDKRLFTGDA